MSYPQENFTQQEEPSEMQIREIFWSEDGWPFVAAQPLRRQIQETDKAGNERTDMRFL